MVESDLPQSPTSGSQVSQGVKRLRDTFGKYVKTVRDRGSDDLVEFKIRDPLSHLNALFDHIRTHGDIPLHINTRIPFMYIFLGLTGIFSLIGLNRIMNVASVCPTTFTTKIGRLHQLTVIEPHVQPVSVFGIQLTGMKLPKSSPQTVLLVNGQTLVLKIVSGVAAGAYDGQTVAATGMYNLCDATLTISYPQNITPIAPANL